MKTTNEFIKELVKIDYLDQFGVYGHYPFQLMVETKAGGLELNALLLGGDVFSCYQKFGKYFREGAVKIFLSLDFPKGGDIEHDFVCVFSVIDGVVDICAIPYNLTTGKTYETIVKSKQLAKILEDFQQVIHK